MLFAYCYFSVIYGRPCCNPVGQRKNHCSLQKAAFIWRIEVDMRVKLSWALLEGSQTAPVGLAVTVWHVGRVLESCCRTRSLCGFVESRDVALPISWCRISASFPSSPPFFLGGGWQHLHMVHFFWCCRKSFCCVHSTCQKGISNVSTSL